MFFSCGNKYAGYEKSESGLYYKFHVTNPTNHVPEKNEIVFMNMSIKLENDSLVQEFKQTSTVMQTPKFKGDIFDALSLMHDGDEATFIINAKQYYNMYNYGQTPDFVKDDKTMLWITIKVDSSMSFERYQLVAENLRRENEHKTIAAYMEEHNIIATPLPSGLYFIETKTGKGNNPVAGQMCHVNYTGKLLDGTVFDTSEGREPFAFSLGSRQVIAGWELGIALMKKSSRAILIIPSYLGYGERAVGSIPSNSPLVFEVELVDIK